MLNGNPDNFFLIPYRDKNGQPKYAKAHKASARHRIQWAWDTVRGSASSKASIGFYPRDSYGKSRWAAMDFDAHDGDKQRPRDLAIKAFTALFQHPGPRSALLLFACSSPTLPKAAFASSANAVTSATEQFPDFVEK